MRGMRWVLCAAVGLVALGGCGSTGGPSPEEAVVTWETADGSSFSAIVDDPVQLQAIRQALAVDGRAGIPNGRLVRGDGDVNLGHAWHLEDLQLADVAIEVCDGTASMVDADVDYWVDTVGQFCPWDARVVAIEGG